MCMASLVVSLMPQGACDLSVGVESLAQLVALRGADNRCRRAEILGNRTIRRQKALGMTGGFEPLQAPLLLTRRLVGILRTVVEIVVLPMFHTGHLPLRRAITLQLIRNDGARYVR